MTQDRAEKAHASGIEASPFAALSETIGALEARLDELMASRSRPAPAPVTEAAAPMAEPAKDTTALIRERQRRLDAFRERARARAGAATELPLQPRAEEPRAEPSQPATDSAESDLREVASALVALRRELRDQLRQDFSQDIARQVGGLRSELVHIRALAERDSMPVALRDELALLVRHVETLRSDNSQQEIAALRGDIASLSEKMETIVREDGRDEIRAMRDGSSAIRDEIAALAARLSDLQETLLALPREDASHEVRAEVHALTSAVEQLLVQEGAGTIHAEDFERVNRRLDELAQAIASIDAAGFERVDARIADLSADLSAAHRATAEALSGQLAILGERVEALAAEGLTGPIAARIDNLSAQIALLGQDGSAAVIEEIADYLRDISARIDGLAQAPAASPDNALLDRFEVLVTRAESQSSDEHAASLERLHRHLDEITGRLDRSLAATPASDEAVRGLEAQIATLSRLMNERSEAPGGDVVSVIAPRLDAIEGHIARSQDDIIEAASKAAERAVASFLESGIDDFDGSADEMKAVAGLADDLKALSEMSRLSDERQARAFDAVHDTLLKIAERLEHLDRSRALPAREPVEEEISAGELTLSGTAVAAAPELALVETRVQAAGSQSLLGRLAQRVRPRAADDGEATTEVSSAATARERLAPTPSIDPTDALDPGAANEPLEPGSGTPDISRILQKVRQQQAEGESETPSARSDADRADFIAAARRAAQAAAADVESASQKRSGKKTGSKSAGDGNSRRRPILIAVGAVLLAVMSYPLAAGFIGGNEPSEQVPEMAVTAEQVPTEETTASVASEPADLDIATDATVTDKAATPPVTRPAETESAALPAAETAPTAEPAAEAALARDTSPTASLTPAPLETQPEAEPVEAEAAPEASGADSNAELQARLDALPDDAAPAALVEAAREGDPRAFFDLAARYSDGRGVTADEEAAAEWYRAAAESGLAPAQFRLATLTEKGIGVERDLGEAQRLYEEAAEAGNVRAMHNLAVLHASGVAGEPDYALAAEWFERAAGHGVADSQFNIAVLYARGSGVEQDLGQSYKWFAIAAEGGDTGAAAKRDEVAEAMDEAALDAARAEVEAWAAQPADAEANEVVLPEEWTVDSTTTATTDPARAVSSVQTILNAEGYDAGTPDGILGEKTVAAIKAFQEAEGLAVTGTIDAELVRALIESKKRG